MFAVLASPVAMAAPYFPQKPRIMMWSVSLCESLSPREPGKGRGDLLVCTNGSSVMQLQIFPSVFIISMHAECHVVALKGENVDISDNTGMFFYVCRLKSSKLNVCSFQIMLSLSKTNAGESANI